MRRADFASRSARDWPLKRPPPRTLAVPSSQRSVAAVVVDDGGDDDEKIRIRNPDSIEKSLVIGHSGTLFNFDTGSLYFAMICFARTEAVTQKKVGENAASQESRLKTQDTQDFKSHQ